jgi:hypothetical protein
MEDGDGSKGFYFLQGDFYIRFVSDLFRSMMWKECIVNNLVWPSYSQRKEIMDQTFSYFLCSFLRSFFGIQILLRLLSFPLLNRRRLRRLRTPKRIELGARSVLFL